MRWITRERIRIDRAACAWLIRNFIDPEAEFVFIPPKGALERAQQEDGIPFVIPGAEFSRSSDRISFDVMLAKYQLNDPALHRLADIVRQADIRSFGQTIPEAEGLRAIVHGFFLMEIPDQETLALELPVFDALYRYCQDQVNKP